MSENVRQQFYEEASTTNKTASAAHVQTYFPITSNITAGVISGQVIFELNTGFNEYLDLFKSHLSLDYTLFGAAGPAFTWNPGDCPLSNIIARGQLYINGVKVAASQNWTQDAVLSKRINFSGTYNKAVNSLTFAVAGAIAPTPAVAGTTYIDDEYLDALFIREESCIIPPNCNVRILLDIDSDYLAKMALADGWAAAPGTMSVNKLKFIAYSVVQSGAIPKEWLLKLITLNSFLSSIAGTNENKQYQVNPSIVKVALTFLSTAYKTPTAAGVNKIQAGNLLKYVTDTAATRLETLDFKLNNIVIPNMRWDFSHGFKEAYINYINESAGISDAACKETFAEWQTYGMIHLANIVKPPEDKSNSLQVACSFVAQPAAFMIITAFEEQIVKIDYNGESSAVLGTTILV